MVHALGTKFLNCVWFILLPANNCLLLKVVTNINFRKYMKRIYQYFLSFW